MIPVKVDQRIIKNYRQAPGDLPNPAQADGQKKLFLSSPAEHSGSLTDSPVFLHDFKINFLKIVSRQHLLAPAVRQAVQNSRSPAQQGIAGFFEKILSDPFQ